MKITFASLLFIIVVIHQTDGWRMFNGKYKNRYPHHKPQPSSSRPAKYYYNINHVKVPRGCNYRNEIVQPKVRTITFTKGNDCPRNIQYYGIDDIIIVEEVINIETETTETVLINNTTPNIGIVYNQVYEEDVTDQNMTELISSTETILNTNLFATTEFINSKNNEDTLDIVENEEDFIGHFTPTTETVSSIPTNSLTIETIFANVTFINIASESGAPQNFNETDVITTETIQTFNSKTDENLLHTEEVFDKNIEKESILIKNVTLTTERILLASSSVLPEVLSTVASTTSKGFINIDVVTKTHRNPNETTIVKTETKPKNDEDFLNGDKNIEAIEMEPILIENLPLTTEKILFEPVSVPTEAVSIETTTTNEGFIDTDFETSTFQNINDTSIINNESSEVINSKNDEDELGVETVSNENIEDDEKGENLVKEFTPTTETIQLTSSSTSADVLFIQINTTEQNVINDGFENSTHQSLKKTGDNSSTTASDILLQEVVSTEIDVLNKTSTDKEKDDNSNSLEDEEIDKLIDVRSNFEE